MADKKISQLTAATTPLAGTEVLPIVQNGNTVQVSNNDLRPKQIQSNATSGVLQVNGPAAASTRVMTTPDANFSVARIDAAQRFAGVQSFLSSAGETDPANVDGIVKVVGSLALISANNLNPTLNRWSFVPRSTGDNVLSLYDPRNSRSIMTFNNSSGDVAVSLGNLVIGTSGKGIDFSATASGSGTMTSELLSDYEEGTWTPTVGGTWTSNPTSLSGTYTKIGRMVQVSCTFTGGTKAATTDGWIAGLPYNVQFEGTGTVVDSNIIVYGSCLAANATRIWLSANSFGAGAKYITLTYMV